MKTIKKSNKSILKTKYINPQKQNKKKEKCLSSLNENKKPC